MNADEIKNYIVKIEYEKQNLESGSGVVVTLDDENSYFYIFSAKHTFFDTGFELNEKRDIQIKLSNPANSFTQELYNVEVVWCKKDYDFIVFKLINDFSFTLPPALSISNDDSPECVIYGYPKIKTDNTFKAYFIQCKNKGMRKDSVFEVTSEESICDIFSDYNTKENMAGLSGAGVFVSDSEIIGIQIKGENANTLVCVDLREIIESLNIELVNKNYKPIKYNEEFSQGGARYNISAVDLKDLKDNLKSEYIKKIKTHDTFDSELDFLLKESTPYHKELNKEYKNLRKNMQKLANTYLYQAIIYHEQNKNRKATTNFQKAVFLSEVYRKAFNLALIERRNKSKNQEDTNLEKNDNTIDDEKIEDNIYEETSYKKYDLLQEIEKNKDNPLKLIELKKLYIDLLDKEEDKEEILNLRFEIAKLFINDKNEILKEIEILFNSIASNSNKRDDFVKKIDEIQKDKDTIIDLNAHLYKIKEEFIESLKNTVNQDTLTESLKETFNQEELNMSLKNIDEKIGKIQNPVIPEEIKEIPNAIEALSNEMKDMKESSNNAMNQQFDKIDKTSDNIKGIISDNSNEILKGIDSNHNQQTILTIGLLFVLSILVFVLVFILIFFTD
jgi:hypothetical protein